MRSSIQFITLLGSIAGLAFAGTPNPQYQKPTIVNHSEDIDFSNRCGDSTFGLITPGEILIDDCAQLTASWHDQGNFTLQLSDWTNSTGLVDHFYTLGTYGSCQFAFKRTDGLNTTVFIGNQDLSDLVKSAISLGNDTYVQTVGGVMPCNADDGSQASIEWSLRQTGQVN